VLTPNQGKPESQYFEKKTNLLKKLSMTLASPMGELPIEIGFADYKPYEGVLTPRTVHQNAMGQEFLIRIDSVQYNADLSKDKFEVPADVKALVNK
jgi:hypothetical protein